MAGFDAGWFDALGAAARAVGDDAFHERLLKAFGGLARHDVATVVRYSRFSKPEFLFHRDFSATMIEAYLATYYPFDPFYRFWREHERPGVVSLKDFASKELKQGLYVRDFLRESRISDEVGAFLPPTGRASIAMFLERRGGRFTAPEIARIARAYPALAGLHAAHVNSAFAAAGKAGPARTTERPTLITDHGGVPVHANAAWTEAARADPAIGRAVAALGNDGTVELPGNRVLHVETLGSGFFLAPRGRLYTLERVASGPATISPTEAAELYRDVLTPRERDVVALVLEGHPTAAIAGRLGLSRGTVKNLRRRIYRKLDITTERELFLLYIEALSRTERQARRAG